jgi:hypothetical protein
VTRAYRHPVDWGAALYEHCIVQGDVNYFTDFTYNMPLTSALVEDVARRFVFVWYIICHRVSQVDCDSVLSRLQGEQQGNWCLICGRGGSKTVSGAHLALYPVITRGTFPMSLVASTKC